MRVKKRDPEFLAYQFTGDVGEFMGQLGPGFDTIYDLKIKNATGISLNRHGGSFYIHKGDWIVIDSDTLEPRIVLGSQFEKEYEPIRKPGRPSKEKK